VPCFLAPGDELAIVNTEFLRWFSIIVNYHPITATKNHMTHFDWTESVDVEMGNQIMTKIEGEIDHILDVVPHVTGACCLDCQRILAD
jgi:hypothetical protein